MTRMDLTEVAVGADGAVDVCVDPSGDETAAGTFARGNELRPGEHVEVVAGEDAGQVGEVESCDGQHVVVKLRNGGALRTTADNVAVSAFASFANVVRAGDRIGSESGKSGHVTGEQQHGQVKVQWDNGSYVWINPDLDAPGNGNFFKMQAFSRASAKCPYCERQTNVFGGRLGDHRVPGGICDGVGRAVQRLDSAGRAVFSRTSDIPDSGKARTGYVYSDADGYMWTAECAGQTREALPSKSAAEQWARGMGATKIDDISDLRR